MKGQPPQNGGKNHACQMVAAKQSPTGVEGKKKKPCQKAQTKKKIRQMTKTLPSTDGTKEIVHETQRQSQSYRKNKFRALNANRQRHQPKSRAKKPPASRALSS